MQVRVTTVSKDDFANWLICPGFAWALIHQPDLVPETDVSTRRREIDGKRMASLARMLIPESVVIETDNPDEALILSAEALASDAAAIFGPTICTDRGVLAQADILIRDGEGWHLVAIKGSAADPDKPRSIIKKYLADITFQTLAFREAGLPIVRSSLLHVDKRYRRNGRLVPQEMLAYTDVTEAVAMQRVTVSAQISEALETLQDASTPAPCNCHRTTRSNRCGLFEAFHPEIPAYGTVYNVTGIHSNVLLPALDRGVISMVDWPDDLPLNWKQRRQVEIARSRQELLDKDAITAFLRTLESPLWFLDYETYQEPVPRWTGYASHQQIPFQYSLHSVDESTGRSHDAYLHTARDVDPVPDLLARLAQDLGPKGSVIVWNKAFEMARNEEMAELHPAYASFLHDVNARMVDLADVVKEGWWAHPRFNGSWSLKSVLPVVAPELGYDELEIGDGNTASESWVRALIDPKTAMTNQERRATLAALDAYCHQDSLALVRIWEYLLDAVTR